MAPPRLPPWPSEDGRDILPHLLGPEKVHLSGREERGCLRCMLTARVTLLGPRSETQSWWVESWPGLWEPQFWSWLNPESQRDLGPSRSLSASVSPGTNKKIESVGEAKCFGFDIEKERAF